MRRSLLVVFAFAGSTAVAQTNVAPKLTPPALKPLSVITPQPVKTAPPTQAALPNPVSRPKFTPAEAQAFVQQVAQATGIPSTELKPATALSGSVTSPGARVRLGPSAWSATGVGSSARNSFAVWQFGIGFVSSQADAEYELTLDLRGAGAVAPVFALECDVSPLGTPPAAVEVRTLVPAEGGAPALHASVQVALAQTAIPNTFRVATPLMFPQGKSRAVVTVNFSRPSPPATALVLGGCDVSRLR